MTSTTFRDTIRDKLSPPWLRAYVGERIMYSMAVQLDALGDAVAAAVQSRFPNVYSPDSLEYIGRDRKMSRGRTTTDENYAARLVTWLDAHAKRGSPGELLRQLFAHFSASPFAADLVYHSGRRFRMAIDGTISIRDDIVWAPDAQALRWARWWLFVDWPVSVPGDGIWNDAGTWSDGGVWDSSLSPQDVSDLRLVPDEWNAAHCSGAIVLLPGDSELWDYPVGTWDDPGLWTDYGPQI